MFTTESEKHDFAIKPMNCPGHIQVFNSDLRSYRDLPLRYGEFGACHRNEPSGALRGIMLVRGFTQDDGHIFCKPEQIEPESADFMMPGRLGAEFVDEDNTRKVPVMLHRAIVGSMERFIGILIENHAGAMPLWLAPVQVVVMNVTDRQESYVREVEAALREAG